MTIRVTVNGVEGMFDEGVSVADVVAGAVSSTSGIAVAVNREVLTRASWETTTLGTGDAIEIVAAAAGG